MGAFDIQDLSFAYPEKTEKALDGVSLRVQPGEFVVLCGPSGCGKTTLLRHLKPILTPHGQRQGVILFDGRPIGELSLREQAACIGYVLQQPENQIVTDKVWHELAFGLESLGEKQEAVRLRVAEMACFFGIQDWFMKKVTELSGGQKQLLNLASIMAMQPSVLILDEPTSQLDPIAAAGFLDTVRKINNELGVTVLLTEHRLEEALPMADRAIAMEGGRILADGSPGEVGRQLRRQKSGLFAAMPAAMRIYAGVEGVGADVPCPVTVKEGRRFLSSLPLDQPALAASLPPAAPEPQGEPVIVFKEVWFKYEKKGEDILKDLSLTVRAGTLHAIVGGNGAGKTTALSLVSRLNRPYRGSVSLAGRRVETYTDAELFRGCLGVLPQNPQALFVKKTLLLDLLEMTDSRLSKAEREREARQAAEEVELSERLDAHPYDLSGGEQQRAALAKVLLLRPKILLLDEPTKGLDAQFKEKLAGIFRRLLGQGATILMVSHDVEFCARHADVCTLFFQGGAVVTAPAGPFFSGNSFYTTAANRMSRHLMAGAVTNEDVIDRCNRHAAV